MGSGVSKEGYSHMCSRAPSPNLPSGSMSEIEKTARNIRLYDKQSVIADASFAEGAVLSNNQVVFLSEVMGNFFHAHNSEEEINASSFVSNVLGCMQQEQFDANVAVITEGANGEKMYVVEKGTLQVTDRHKVKQSLKRGDMFGQITLVCNTANSEVTTTLEPCTLWSLLREDFKKMQKLASDENIKFAVDHLELAPEVKLLCEDDTNHLVHRLHTSCHDPGSILLEQGKTYTKVMLIRQGSVHVGIPGDTTLPDCSTEELEELYGIITPPGAVIQKETRSGILGLLIGRGSVIIGPLRSRIFVGDEPENPKLKWGTFMARPVKDNGSFDIDSPSKGLNPAKEGLSGRIVPGCIGGALCPFTLSAVDEVHCSYFSIGAFDLLAVHSLAAKESAIKHAAQFNNVENVFELLDNAVKNELDEGIAKIVREKSNEIVATNATKETKIETFKESDFKNMSCVSNIHMGFIVAAETTGSAYMDENGKPTKYIIKMLSKQKIYHKKQVRAVIDEANIVAETSLCHFIATLYGKYQTPSYLCFVFEPLATRDLWSIIYDQAPIKTVYSKITGSGSVHNVTVTTTRLSNDLIRFYAGNVMLALFHLHAKNFCFRNLKPENLLFNRNGYMKLVGFGFAKKIPFMFLGNIQHKSFTLCGTPEYLAPELVMTSGHDQQVDMWALGILIYEMCCGCTPWMQRGSEDIGDLFARIAAVKTKRIHLHTAMSEREPDLRSLVGHLLFFNPTERYNVSAVDNEKSAFDAEFFANDPNFMWSALAKMELPVPTMPELTQVSIPVRDDLPFNPSVGDFVGDQTMFNDF